MAAKGLGEKKQKNGLGRGLDALIKGSGDIDPKHPIEGDKTVPIEKIEPNKSQPRKHFEEDALNELADSIKKVGLLNPLLVRQKDGYYEIIGGERRWRASKIAGLTELPVIILELNDKEVAEISLIDNLQREDLNPIEEALAYKRLIDEFDLKQDEVADRVSKSRVTITNSMRLLKLEDKIQQMLIEGMLSSGHARALLAYKEVEGESRVAFAERIFDEQMSVREVEKEIKKSQNKKGEKARKMSNNPQMDAVYEEAEEQLKNSLGTKVKINPKSNHKGIIEIEYYSEEQLTELVERLNG